MKNSLRLLKCYLLILLGFGVAPVMSVEGKINCEIELQEILHKDVSETKKISSWLAKEESCSGSGYYEYHLSKLYISVREYDEASYWIKKGLSLKTEYSKFLSLAVGDLNLHQKNYNEAIKAYERTIEKYPSWYVGYSNMGFALMASGRPGDALPHFEKAISLGGDFNTYRDATLAYYLVGKHEESIAALNSAYNLNNGILRDRDPMIAGIRSYAELGRFELAKKMLALLLHYRPELKEDTEYLKTGHFVKQKMVEAGVLDDQ